MNFHHCNHTLKNTNHHIMAFCGGFLAVAFSVPFWPKVPSAFSACIICLFLVMFHIKYRHFTYVGLAIGIVFFYANAVEYLTLKEFVLHEREHSITAQVHYYKTALPNRVTSARFKVINAPSFTGLEGKMIKLNHYQTHHEYVHGQQWQLDVKLKPLNNRGNPAQFDYAKYLLGQGVFATGYIKKAQLVDDNSGFKRYTAQYISSLDLQYSHYINALLLGIRPPASDSNAIIIGSGTMHLFVISGFHVGIVSGLVLLMIKSAGLLVQVNSRRSRWWHQCLQVLCTLCLLSLYLHVIGPQVSIVRAVSAVSIILLVTLVKAKLAAFDLLLLTASLVVLSMPWSILQSGFYLSFFAVFSILGLIWLLGPLPRQRQHKWIYTAKLQVGLFVAMLPLQAFFIGLVSLSGLLANLLLVPLFSVVVLPLVFVILLLMTVLFGFRVGLSSEIFTSLDIIISFALSFLDRLLSGIFASLAWLTNVIPVWENAITPVQTLWLIISFVTVLIVRFMSLKRINAVLAYLGISMCCVMVMRIDYSAKYSEFIVFSVGHGAMALLSTPQQTLLFDTGYAWNEHASAVNHILQPYLEYRRVDKIEHVFISHFDSDHAGGLRNVMDAWPNINVHSPNDSCIKGQRLLAFSEVQLDAFWPPPGYAGTKNNRSCVLRLQVNGTSILLPGDIEAKAEQVLVQSGAALRSDIVIAPHHGSKSSSSIAFVDAVSPSAVVFSTAYLNRWSLPNNQVTTRYDQALHYNTAVDGAIVIRLYPNNRYEIARYKRDIAPHWYDEL